MASKREYVHPFLHLMLRDDILGWHASKSQAVSLSSAVCGLGEGVSRPDGE